MRSTVALEAKEKGIIGIEADMLIFSDFTSTSLSQQVKARFAVVINFLFLCLKYSNMLYIKTCGSSNSA